MGDAILYYCWPFVYAFVASLAVHALCVILTPKSREPASYEVVFFTCTAICVAGLAFYLEQGITVYPANAEAFLIAGVAAMVGALAYVIPICFRIMLLGRSSGERSEGVSCKISRIAPSVLHVRRIGPDHGPARLVGMGMRMLRRSGRCGVQNAKRSAAEDAERECKIHQRCAR